MLEYNGAKENKREKNGFKALNSELFNKIVTNCLTKTNKLNFKQMFIFFGVAILLS